MHRRILWLFVVLLLMVACESVPSAPLLELSGVTPRRIELGDKLEIEGASLPEGRQARVVFRGVLHRPGESPEDTEIDTTGRVVARDRIEVPVTADLVAALCGEGRTALHTTFVGSLEIVFAAQRPGAPPVSGMIDGAEIDVVPQGVRRSDEDGLSALAAIGVHLATPDDNEPTVAGFVVGSVDRGSRAERAGLAPSDRIMAFAGVRVLTVGDVALPPGRASTQARVAHGSSTTEEEIVISIDGVAPPARGRVSLGLALSALVAAAILALIGPPARTLAWVERRLGHGLTVRRSQLGLPVILAMIASVLILPLARPVFAARLDLALVSVTIVLAWTALGAMRAASLRRLAKTISEHLVVTLPMFIALGALAARNGSLALDDAMRAQGPAPWEMTVARSPVGIALLALLLAPWALPSNANETKSAVVPTLFACAVAATLLLGGWRYVDVAPNHVAAFGVVLFAAKVGALFWIVRWVRRSLPTLPMRAWLRWVWPMSMAIVVMDLLCQRAALSPIAGSVSFVVVCALASFVAFRARRISRGQAPRIHANALL